jgi:putative ABC transport system ATP-binding protein
MVERCIDSSENRSEDDMAVIETRDIVKIYNQGNVPVYALTGISLSIEKGEFVAVVGPSGSGKTTLLNIIGGLDQPTSGQVYVDDTDLSAMRAEELTEFRLRHIGFVFQAYNLVPVLTARENVEFIMLLQGIAKRERLARASALLDDVGLAGRMNSRPSELSGGQQQRVAVARALASHPTFVLADEPTANLDSVTAESLMRLMERLNHEHQMTFLFSTHDTRVIRRAHRIVTLEDGRVASDAQNPEASRFIRESRQP